MGKTKRGKKNESTPAPATSNSKSPAEEASSGKKLEKMQVSNEGENELEEKTSQAGDLRAGSLSGSEKVSRERARPRSQHRLVEVVGDNVPRRRRNRSRERERSRRRGDSNRSRREHRRQLGSISHSRNRRRSTDSRRRNGERRNAQANHPTDWESLVRRGSRYEPRRFGQGER